MTMIIVISDNGIDNNVGSTNDKYTNSSQSKNKKHHHQRGNENDIMAPQQG